MTILLGFLMVMGLVFGGYSLSGGDYHVLFEALPFEGMMLLGASVGSVVVANSGRNLLRIGTSLVRCFRGPKWKAADYRDLLGLMNELAAIYSREGILALDPHIEDPVNSTIFQRYPRVTGDAEVVALIVDSFRVVGMQLDNPHELAEVLQTKLEANRAEAEIPQRALSNMADGLPAIGIVVAVLGVIKTMASVDKPPAILGMMIAGALVGTFLGVFFAYCLVAPIAQKIEQIDEQDSYFARVICDVVVAIVAGHPAPVATEIGRGTIPPAMRPSFTDLEQLQRGAIS